MNDQSPSVPRRYRAPRPLTSSEQSTLRRIADILIPATDSAPCASSELGFDEYASRALDARADAFDSIVRALHSAPSRDACALGQYLRQMHDEQSDTFQALSAVVAEAWLLTPSVRQRIGYHGQQRRPADLEEAVDQLSDGILDPVLSMENESPGRWAR